MDSLAPALLNDFLHPVAFLQKTREDSLELCENLIDWKNGTLPPDVRIGEMALSVFGRIGGVIVLGAALTFAAVLLASPSNMTLLRISSPLTAGALGCALLLLGKFSPEIKYGSSEQVHGKGMVYSSCDISKARLGWREYVITRVGSARIEESGQPNKTFTFTTYTHFSGKEGNRYGIVETVYGENAEELSRDALCLFSELSDGGKLPKHVRKYVGIS